MEVLLTQNALLACAPLVTLELIVQLSVLIILAWLMELILTLQCAHQHSLWSILNVVSIVEQL